jgi:hypothetical protein
VVSGPREGTIPAGTALVVPRRTFAQRLTPRSELATVLTLTFAYPVVTSAMSAVAPDRIVRFDGSVAWLIAYEIAAGIAAARILARRGWRARDLGLAVPWPPRTAASDLVRGVLLFAGGTLVYGFVHLLLAEMGFVTAAPPVFDSSGLGLDAGVALVAVNVVFEETLACAYVVSALRAHPTLAVWTSATLRAAYHTYQGPAAAAGILALGLVHASVFSRWRRVAPLAIAHALLLFRALLYSGW